MYLFYEWTTPNDFPEAAVIDEVMDFNESFDEQAVVDIIKHIRREGGIVVCEEGWEIDPEKGYENPEKIEWVTPVTTFNQQKGSYVTYGNEPSVEMAYADLCLFVRIGKAGERLAYPTVSQLEKERKRDPHTSPFWHRWE